MRQEIDSLIIEWDDAKNDLNVKKHKLSFTTAAQIFYDANRIEIYDTAHSVNENRYITIGMVDKIISVIYTERRKTIRIISARVATSAERRMYYGKNGKNGN